MSHSQRQTRLVKLVRKLLELARSNSNAHEAGLALARAQKLMAKYGISELEANLSSIQSAPSQGAPSEAQKLPEWMISLVWAVSRAFGCRPYFSWRDTPSGQRRNVTFYGFSERPAVAAYAFDVLSRQLKESTADYLKTQNSRLKLSTRRARAEQFRAGWVRGVQRVISSFPVSDNEQQLMTTWIANQDMVDAKTRALKGCRGGDLARSQGFKAGQNARLHQGVQGDGPVVIAHSIGGE